MDDRERPKDPKDVSNMTVTVVERPTESSQYPAKLPSWPAGSVMGSIELDEDRRLGKVPVPSQDPKDPLNFPKWRKWLAITTLAISKS
jgi:hypothetical protein